jgi:hypothetical protein
MRMSGHDNYERLCKYYELAGRIKDREAFKQARPAEIFP